MDYGLVMPTRTTGKCKHCGADVVIVHAPGMITVNHEVPVCPQYLELLEQLDRLAPELSGETSVRTAGGQMSLENGCRERLAQTEDGRRALQVLDLWEIQCGSRLAMVSAALGVLRMWLEIDEKAPPGSPRARLQNDTHTFVKAAEQYDPSLTVPLMLLELLEQREGEAFAKLQAYPSIAREANFPFALMEWSSYANSLELLRRKLRK